MDNRTGNGTGGGSFGGSMAVSAGAAPASAGGSDRRRRSRSRRTTRVKKDDILYISLELDYEDGRKVYEVEFYTKDYREYDYEISAATAR